MYVLEATRETQGKREDDYVWTIDGELVFVPTVDCRSPRCGCDRGFAGTTSHRATTTAMIADRPDLESDTYREALAEAMREQGYDFDDDEPLDDVVDELVDAVQTLGTTFGDRTVVERSGAALRVRRPGR